MRGARLYPPEGAFCTSWGVSVPSSVQRVRKETSVRLVTRAPWAALLSAIFPDKTRSLVQGEKQHSRKILFLKHCQLVADSHPGTSPCSRCGSRTKCSDRCQSEQHWCGGPRNYTRPTLKRVTLRGTSPLSGHFVHQRTSHPLAVKTQIFFLHSNNLTRSKSPSNHRAPSLEREGSVLTLLGVSR